MQESRLYALALAAAWTMFSSAVLADDGVAKEPSVKGKAYIRTKTQQRIQQLNDLIKLDEYRTKLFPEGDAAAEARIKTAKEELEPLKSGKAVAMPPLILDGLAPGQVGKFHEQQEDGFFFIVEKVIDDDQVVVAPVMFLDIRPGPGGTAWLVVDGKNEKAYKFAPLWVKGTSTQGLVAGGKVALNSTFEVTGRKPVSLGKTRQAALVLESVTVTAPSGHASK